MSFKLAITCSVLSVTAVACVSSHFAQLDRPVVIADVAIGLLDQSCGYRLASSAQEQRAVDVQLTIQARNTGLLNATFDPRGISLLAGGAELSAVAADETTIIRPGSERTFTMRFEGPGPVRCNGPMAVVLDRALEPPPSRTSHQLLRFRGRSAEARALRTNL
jgi:hypothetical protein